MENILGIVFLATLIEGLITYLWGSSADQVPAKPRPWLKYISLFLGVVLCLAYKIDIPAMFGLTATTTYVGSVLSGIIVGRGSNYVNDLLGSIQSKSV